MRSNLTILILAVALTGCMNQSKIQGKYTVQQDECRRTVARSLAASSSSTATPEGQNAAGIQFSECMNKAGWHVSMPKPGPVATGPAPNPPAGSPSTNPHAAAAVAPPQTAATQTVPSGAPSTNPIAAARVQPNPPSGVSNNTPPTSVQVQSVSATRTGEPNTALPGSPPALGAGSAPAPATDSVTGPARYQPARPTSTPAVNYGTGAGRQF